MIRKGMRGMMLMLNLLRKMSQKFQVNPRMKSPSSTSILQALRAPPPALGRAGRSHDDLGNVSNMFLPPAVTISGVNSFWVRGLNWFNVQVTFNFVTWFPLLLRGSMPIVEALVVLSINVQSIRLLNFWTATTINWNAWTLAILRIWKEICCTAIEMFIETVPNTSRQ